MQTRDAGTRDAETQRWTRVFLTLACLLAASFLLNCSANGPSGSGYGGSPPGTIEDIASADASFGDLFTGSPCNPPGLGMVGCTQKGYPCNPNWNDYFSTTSTSISMATGGVQDCRTVNTHDQCNFSVGDGGVTQISFDFSVEDSCHGSDGTEWLAFWIYSDPWASTLEVDFIESKFGPSAGLNTNFAGNGHQVVIYDAGTTGWSGSVTAKFSGSGNDVSVSVSNSVNSNVGTSTLTGSDGYFFVMDTAAGSTDDCSFTISNLQMEGTVPAGQCSGAISN